MSTSPPCPVRPSLRRIKTIKIMKITKNAKIQIAINAGSYTYKPEHVLKGDDDREFRRLLGWPAIEVTSDLVDGPFYEFFTAVNELLNQYSSLPDGDNVALRTSEVRDEALSCQRALAALCGALEPGNAEAIARWGAVKRLLSDHGYDGLGCLQGELDDDFAVALDGVSKDLAAASGPHGKTNIARIFTIDELTQPS
jgi:hypothetical protein